MSDEMVILKELQELRAMVLVLVERQRRGPETCRRGIRNSGLQRWADADGTESCAGNLDGTGTFSAVLQTSGTHTLSATSASGVTGMWWELANGSSNTSIVSVPPLDIASRAFTARFRTIGSARG